MATTFTLEDIDRAHKGVSSKSVRQYLTMLHSLGDIYYASYISDGHSEYFDRTGNTLSCPAVHPPVSSRAPTAAPNTPSATS